MQDEDFFPVDSVKLCTSFLKESLKLNKSLFFKIFFLTCAQLLLYSNRTQMFILRVIYIVSSMFYDTFYELKYSNKVYENGQNQCTEFYFLFDIGKIEEITHVILKSMCMCLCVYTHVCR